jgi:hypothetical protein
LLSANDAGEVARGGFTIATKPTVTVTTGVVSGVNSTLSFATPTVASGNIDTLTIVVRDGASNAVSGLTNGALSFSLSGGAITKTLQTARAVACNGAGAGGREGRVG